MLQACRPARRLFYWVLAVAVVTTGVRLAAREVSARQPAKPMSCPEAKSRVAGSQPRARFATTPSSPTMTNVIGTVYRADGTLALNFLAKYNGASAACALKAGTSDTDGVIGAASGGPDNTEPSAQ
jgi:hypothetical protein